MNTIPTDDVRKTQGKFPVHMGLNRDIFEFSHAAASDIARRIRSPGDLLDLLGIALDDIQSSNLAKDDIEQLKTMIDDEINIIEFSSGARRSVVEL